MLSAGSSGISLVASESEISRDSRKSIRTDCPHSRRAKRAGVHASAAVLRECASGASDMNLPAVLSVLACGSIASASGALADAEVLVGPNNPGQSGWRDTARADDGRGPSEGFSQRAGHRDGLL